jgi:D-alanyl-D-alanine carboxypeptidase/D-alanyl-D-alanine-endopeptidase (penicillin-binding protein 4)
MRTGVPNEIPKLVLTALLIFGSAVGQVPSSPAAAAPAALATPQEIASSPPLDSTGPSPALQLSSQIGAILGKPGLAKVLFSVCIVSGDTGEIVYEKNPHLALLPASNMKIVTTAAALDSLGRDFGFTTQVGLCGEALVVKGSGDPLFGDRKSEAKNGHRPEPIIPEIVAGLKGMGIGAVSDIVLDDSIFDSQRVHPSWPKDQLHQKYACEVCGLNYSGNCVDITAANRRGTVVLSLDPPTDYLKLRNAVTVWKSPKSWFSVARTDVPGELLIEGNCRAQAGPYSVAVENPALFFGRLIRDALIKAGIRVAGEVLEQPAPEGCALREIARYDTPIRDVLPRTNKDSLNLAAESLFKRLGAQASPDGKGSWETGGKAVAEYLRRLGVDEGEFVIVDGSGLSRDDRLSAYALTRVLMHVASGPDAEFFKGSLAVGGLDGTIVSHFWERKYRGRVSAKTGYIEAVRALSGFVHTDRGDFIFSFLANHGGNGARGAIESAVKAIIDLNSRAASGRK